MHSGQKCIPAHTKSHTETSAENNNIVFLNLIVTRLLTHSRPGNLQLVGCRVTNLECKGLICSDEFLEISSEEDGRT